MTRFFSSLLAMLIVPLGACGACQSTPGVYASSIGGFWQGFTHYWSRLVTSVDGVVMMAIGLGALGIFIITRGKWIK